MRKTPSLWHDLALFDYYATPRGPLKDNATISLLRPGPTPERAPAVVAFVNQTLGTREYRLHLVPLSELLPKEVKEFRGFETIGEVDSDLGSGPFGRGDYVGFFLDKLKNGYYAAPGKYSLVAHSLRVFGDASKDEDW